MSNKSSQGGGGPGGRTRRQMSGDRQQPLNVNKCKELIHDMLISTGQCDLLKRLIQSRLAQTGWTYSMRAEYIEYIKQKGVENVNVAHMIADTVPIGLRTFPDAIRKEITDVLWEFSTQYIRPDDSVQRPPDTDTSCTTAELFQYQSKEARPDPGLGVNVVMPQLNISRTPSPITVPRPLTPQPPLPILRPETFETEIKEEPVNQDEDEMSSEEEDEEEEEEEEINHNDEEEEEELMDV